MDGRCSSINGKARMEDYATWTRGIKVRSLGTGNTCDSDKEAQIKQRMKDCLTVKPDKRWKLNGVTVGPFKLGKGTQYWKVISTYSMEGKSWIKEVNRVKQNTKGLNNQENEFQVKKKKPINKM